MSGPTQPWDQSGDPRESTVDLPRLDLTGLADYFRGPAGVASATPSEPGLTNGPSRARGSAEPGLPERAGLLEPLPEPDSGRFSRPSRQSEPAGFRDPYASPRPGGDLGPPRAARPAEPAPPPSLASRTDTDSGPGPAPPAGASSPGQASVADFAVGPADASLALSLAPVNESAGPAASEPARIPTPEADVSAAIGPEHDVAAAISPDSIAGAPRAAANPSPAATFAQPAAPGRADPSSASVAAAAPEGTSGFATADGGAADPAGLADPADPADPAGRGEPARAAQARRTPPGSVADLRSRLARLPDGHPSSPYDDGGQRRPLPTRLKQLELGLPAPGRDLSGGSWPDVDIDHGEPHRTSRDQASPDPARPDPARPDPARPDSEPPDRARLDRVVADAPTPDDGRPADLAAGPAEPATGDRSPAAAAPAEWTGADAPIRGDAAPRPSRPEWEDPYASGRGQAAASAPGDLALGPWPAENAPAPSALDGIGARGRNGNGNGHGANGNGRDQRRALPAPDRPEPRQPDPRQQVPLQQDARRPDARPHDERPHDERPHDMAGRETIEHRIMPAGAPADARAATTGSPAADDLRALVERTLANCRAAEGRNVFGGYGSSGLTPLIHRIAAQLPFGDLAPGSEADSLKSPDRFAAKLARLIARNPGRSPEELAASIGDTVRYAFVFEAADYIEGTWLIHRKLKSHGFELEVRRNRWESPEYKGIFTMWRDPAHGLAFEVQFHTTASWTVVRKTYDMYVQITDPATRPADRAQLRARQVAAAAAARGSPYWAEIADFRLEPR
jgi:hypothetical protein